MEARISQMIEEEVERRVNERIGQVLEQISKTYDVSMKQLLRDAAVVKSESGLCLGVTAKNKRCGRRACKKNNDGYCAQHNNQKPTIVRTISTAAISNLHTHPPSQMFVKGCMGCDRKRCTSSLMIDI
jgi:hypothetical protein